MRCPRDDCNPILKKMLLMQKYSDSETMMRVIVQVSVLQFTLYVTSAR